MHLVVCYILTQINKYLKNEASHINSVIKAILFGTIVAHSSLLVSQALGSGGLDHWYPFDNHLLEEALHTVLQHINKDDNKAALLESLQIVPEVNILLLSLQSSNLCLSFFKLVMLFMLLLKCVKNKHFLTWKLILKNIKFNIRCSFWVE